MELKCPVCQRAMTVDAGSDAFYCKRCNKAYSTARCFHQQREIDKPFFIQNHILYAYHGDKTQVVIPNQVTQIGAGCFADNQVIEQITFPNSVEIIEAHAFANCRNLISVELPERLTYIGMGAFADCVTLSQMNIPQSTSVDCGAFLRCSELKLSIYRHSSIISPSYIGLAPQQISYRDTGCYITTAICEERGEPDNGPMLTKFRLFRDHWLVHQPNGKEDIQAYYRTAPEIVRTIKNRDDADTILEGIYQTYLKPCFDLLTQGEYEKCRAIYTAMVKACEKAYLAPTQD